MTYLDTRDLYQEMQELNDRQQQAADPEPGDESDPLDDVDEARLEALADLFDEIGESAGIHGATLIPDSDFADYARELAEDITGHDYTVWPLNNIDWEDAADDLRADYSSVTFEGDDYLMQSY